MEKDSEFMKHLGRLDKVLFALHESPLGKKGILNTDLYKISGIDSEEEFNRIVERIIEDGYAKHLGNINIISIKNMGESLYYRHGYVQQEIDNINLREYQKQYEARVEGIASRTEQSASSLTRRTRNLANYTFWLALATMLLVLVELGTKWDELMHVTFGRP